MAARRPRGAGRRAPGENRSASGGGPPGPQAPPPQEGAADARGTPPQARSEAGQVPPAPSDLPIVSRDPAPPHPGAVVLSDRPPHPAQVPRHVDADTGLPPGLRGCPPGCQRTPPALPAPQRPAHGGRRTRTCRHPRQPLRPFKVQGCRVPKGAAGGSDVRLAHVGAGRYLKALATVATLPGVGLRRDGVRREGHPQDRGGAPRRGAGLTGCGGGFARSLPVAKQPARGVGARTRVGRCSLVPEL